MISVPVTLTGTALSVASLIVDELPDDVATLVGNRDDFRMDSIIQAPITNGDDVNIGSETDQSGFIISGGSASLDRLNLNKTYINGTVGDVAIILLMD